MVMNLKTLLNYCLDDEYIIYRRGKGGVKYERRDIPKPWYKEDVDVWWAGMSDDGACVKIKMEDEIDDN